MRKRTKCTKWDAVPALSDGVIHHIHDFVDVPGLKVWAHCGRTAFTDCYKKMARFPRAALKPHMLRIQYRDFEQSDDVMPIHVHAMVHRTCVLCGGPWQGRLHWPWLIPAHPTCLQPLLQDMRKCKYIPIDFVRVKVGKMYQGHVIARPHRAIQEKHTLAHFETMFKDEIEAYRCQFEMEAYNLHKEHRESILQNRIDQNAAYAAGHEARVAKQNQFIAAFPDISTWSEALYFKFPACITHVVDDDVLLAIGYAEIYLEYCNRVPPGYWPWSCAIFGNVPATQVRSTLDALVEHPDISEHLKKYKRTFTPVLSAEHVYNLHAMLTVRPPGSEHFSMSVMVNLAISKMWSAETRARLVACKDTIPANVWRHVLPGFADSDESHELLEALMTYPAATRDVAKVSNVISLSAQRVADLAYMREIFPAEDDSHIRLRVTRHGGWVSAFHRIMADTMARKSPEFMRELAWDIEFTFRYLQACSASCCEPITAWGRDRIHKLPLHYHDIAKIGEFLAAGM
ncbi:hypothetical protein JKP88DRAFT_307670 [Tribonema minus]|uniref:Uncharacterized protein n=1 Tax=Tribonema minus TaxID=303371 RepID=A0A835Z4H2_9STRA|nr:hypothetical protein JKP88DRAFT_307670 [Tribonema minus]